MYDDNFIIENVLFFSPFYSKPDVLDVLEMKQWFFSLPPALSIDLKTSVSKLDTNSKIEVRDNTYDTVSKQPL